MPYYNRDPKRDIILTTTHLCTLMAVIQRGSKYLIIRYWDILARVIMIQVLGNIYIYIYMTIRYLESKGS